MRDNTPKPIWHFPWHYILCRLIMFLGKLIDSIFLIPPVLYVPMFFFSRICCSRETNKFRPFQLLQINLIEAPTMIIVLTLEMWNELFGFVPRAQLKQLVAHFWEKCKRDRRGRVCQQTVVDRVFVTFDQFFLHTKYIEVTFGRLNIYPSKNWDEPIVKVNENVLPLSDVPICENVKNFEEITISDYGKSNHYDESVIAFLRKFEQNSMLDNINLCFYNCSTYLLQIMTNFLPLFTSINSIAIHSLDVLDKLQCEYSELAIATSIFTSAPHLYTYYNCRDFWFCEWLHIPREDGKPRALYLIGYQEEDRLPLSLYHFIKHIKKDFLEANQAVSFFIRFHTFRDEDSVQSLTLENGKTHEKLAIKGKTGDNKFLSISRCPMGTNEEELSEEVINDFNDHRIINRHVAFKQGLQ